MTKEKGFTLLELCMCLVIFGVFIECLGGFFNQCSMRYRQYREQLELTQEGQNVEDFIRDCIRRADKVQIKTESGKVIEAIDQALGVQASDIESERLWKIECVRTAVEKGTRITEKYRLEMKKSGGNYSGKYALVYSGGYVSNIVSEQIENIKVTKDKDSDRVLFECSLQKENEGNTRINYTKCFSESLEYKAPI